MKHYHYNIEITKHCNQNCFYCFNNSGRNTTSHIKLLEFKSLVRNLSHQGMNSILLTGGEPFLHPNILEFIRYSINKGIKTSILSNGFNISNVVHKYPNLISKLSTAQISLDSMNLAINDSRRGYNGAFKSAISAIESLISIDVNVEISCVVDESNIDEIDLIADYAKSINAKLLIRPILKAGRAKNINLQSNTLRIIDKKIVQLEERVQIVSDSFDYVLNSNLGQITSNFTIPFEKTPNYM